MDTNNELPKLKISRTKTDWLLEVIAFIFIILLVALPLIYRDQLPEKIPTHYNASGQPDDYGSVTTIWLVPVIGFILYLILTILESFPHIYNYPVKITPQNAPRQYAMATRLIRGLKTILVIGFSFLTYQTIQVALNRKNGLGKLFLPIALTIVFGILFFTIIKARKTSSSTEIGD